MKPSVARERSYVHRIEAPSKYSELAAVVLFQETRNRTEPFWFRDPAAPEHQSCQATGVACHAVLGGMSQLAAAILGPSLKRLCDLVTCQERPQ